MHGRSTTVFVSKNKKTLDLKTAAGESADLRPVSRRGLKFNVFTTTTTTTSSTMPRVLMIISASCDTKHVWLHNEWKLWVFKKIIGILIWRSALRVPGCRVLAQSSWIGEYGHLADRKWYLWDSTSRHSSYKYWQCKVSRLSTLPNQCCLLRIFG